MKTRYHCPSIGLVNYDPSSEPDHMLDQGIECEGIDEVFPELKYGPDFDVWETKDGRKIRVSEMSDAHLVNVVRMFWRHHEARAVAIACSPEQMAEDAWLDHEDGEPDHPVYCAMVDEMARRGLSEAIDEARRLAIDFGLGLLLVAKSKAHR